MDEFDKIIKKLDEIYLYSGIAGVVFFLLLADDLYNEYWKDQKPYFDNFLVENRDFINLAKKYIS